MAVGHQTVPRIQFGHTDLQVSRICFGLWQAGGDWGTVDEHGITTAVERALALGINFFDTAQAYGFGASETLLGRALRERITYHRDTVVIATKGGLRKEGAQLVRDASPAWLRQGIEASLKALSTDYVDLYQLHWPDANTPVEETAETLESFVREGKARFIGLSNFDVPQMEAFARTRRIDALQPPYDMFRREIEREILPYCKSHDIGVLVYGPLAHGILAGTMTTQTRFASDDWRSKSATFTGPGFERNLAVVEQLKEAARSLGVTLPQLAVAWVLANPAVHVAIVGARDAGHLEETARGASIRLTQKTMDRIERILAEAEPQRRPSPESV
jgi:aryl-alcohol dehydrogenase-like predicted oxidoreductase